MDIPVDGSTSCAPYPAAVVLLLPLPLLMATAVDPSLLTWSTRSSFAVYFEHACYRRALRFLPPLFIVSLSIVFSMRGLTYSQTSLSLSMYHMRILQYSLIGPSTSNHARMFVVIPAWL